MVYVVFQPCAGRFNGVYMFEIAYSVFKRDHDLPLEVVDIRGVGVIDDLQNLIGSFAHCYQILPCASHKTV